VIRTHALRWLPAANANSVGFGYRVVDDVVTSEIAVQFSVPRKLTRAQLKALGGVAIPARLTLPDGREVATDVVQRQFRCTDSPPGPPGIDAARRSRLDPVRPGASIGHFDGGAGTLGALVRAPDGTLMALSCWHVLAGPGIDLGQMISQPGPVDDADEIGNRIGLLVRRHLSLAGDAAVCTVERRGADASILGLERAITRAREPVLGERVAKSGRTTGVTCGVVSRIDVIGVVSYPQGDRNIGGFEVAADPGSPPADGLLTEKGDSGAIWAVNAGGPESDVGLGMQVCGTDNAQDGSFALACHLTAVLDRLQVQLASN
jgi:endonuclease G